MHSCASSDSSEARPQSIHNTDSTPSTIPSESTRDLPTMEPWLSGCAQPQWLLVVGSERRTTRRNFREACRTARPQTLVVLGTPGVHLPNLGCGACDTCC
eukprot:215769-Prymnesium_polylepis.2